MKIKLIRHKRRVLAWSLALWPVYLAGLLGLLPYAVPYLDGYLPRWVLILILALSPLGRVIDQGDLHADD